MSEWMKVSEGVPSKVDQDDFGMIVIWAHNYNFGLPELVDVEEFAEVADPSSKNAKYMYWTHTGLIKPEPPQ